MDRTRRHLPQTPCLILLMGVAGTGKSTLAREIIRHLSAVYLDNNHITDAFFPDTRSTRRYQGLRPAFYKALYTIAEENLKIGNSVLLDAPHIKEVQTRSWRILISKIVKRTKTTLVVIRCLCSESVLLTRISRRGEQRDKWKLTHWNEFLTTEPIEVPISFPHLDINTERSLSKNAVFAVKYIESRIAPPPGRRSGN